MTIHGVPIERAIQKFFTEVHTYNDMAKKSADNFDILIISGLSQVHKLFKILT